MSFTSPAFLIFFSLFFALYWIFAGKNLRITKHVLFYGNVIFYGILDWRMLPLLFMTAFFSWFMALMIEKTSAVKKRKLFLNFSLLTIIGSLVVFKYLNFFSDSVKQLFSIIHIQLPLPVFHLILPLGISFYTFRIISYLLDVDKGKMEAVKDWMLFFNYVAFFPSIVSGPIDKAKTLVPQMEKEKIFQYDQGVDGLRQILWGMFKKLVIADNCAVITNDIFSASDPSGSSVLLGAFLYTIQIYADFSGYSDMAIGVAKLLGLSITRNFEYPFFAQNIAEFWRKWHMSLTGWLTEYVFTPLTIYFRDREKTGLVMAILINFIIIGFWHGPNWTFVIFGFLHGTYYIPLILSGKLNKRNKIGKDQNFPTLAQLSKMLGTFWLVMLTFVLFRSNNISEAAHYYGRIFSLSLFSLPVLKDSGLLFTVMIFAIVMLALEWKHRDLQHALQISKDNKLFHSRKSLRWAAYFLLFFTIICFAGKEQDFIYLRF